MFRELRPLGRVSAKRSRTRQRQGRRSDRTRAESMASPAHLAGFDLLRQRLSVYFGEDEEPAWYEGAVDDFEHDGTCYGYTCHSVPTYDSPPVLNSYSHSNSHSYSYFHSYSHSLSQRRRRTSHGTASCSTTARSGGSTLGRVRVRVKGQGQG